MQSTKTPAASKAKSSEKTVSSARKGVVDTQPPALSAEAGLLQPSKSFQDLILTLQQFWAAQGCVILQPYDMEVGAGTFHPATTLRALGPRPWYAAYVQPSRRPKDGRYGENPNRLQHYYQFQVIMKPSPAEHPGSLSAEPLQDRHRSGQSRHPLRRGRLGEPDAGRLGARLGGLVRRHGGVAVHLFPAGRRLRLRSGLGRADLRAGTPRHVLPGRRPRLRPQLQRPRGRAQDHSMATSSCRPSRNIPGTISNMPIPRCCCSTSAMPRKSARRCWRPAHPTGKCE